MLFASQLKNSASALSTRPFAVPHTTPVLIGIKLSTPVLSCSPATYCPACASSLRLHTFHGDPKEQDEEREPSQDILEKAALAPPMLPV